MRRAAERPAANFQDRPSQIVDRLRRPLSADVRHRWTHESDTLTSGPRERLVFVSHSGTDTWVAKQIAREIAACGATPFLDEAQIDVGADFEEDILAFLEKADELVVLITPWARRDADGQPRRRGRLVLLCGRR